MARPRVTASDLEWAATWLEAYEDLPDDVNDPDGPGKTFARVAKWLRAEAEARETEASVRVVVRRTGADPARARAAVRSARANQTSG